jgi:hypothetical protein
MLLLNVAITQVYTVVIGHRPSCSCEHNWYHQPHRNLYNLSFLGPDATKGNHCKHIVRTFSCIP